MSIILIKRYITQLKILNYFENTDLPVNKQIFSY